MKRLSTNLVDTGVKLPLPVNPDALPSRLPQWSGPQRQAPGKRTAAAITGKAAQQTDASTPVTQA